jgi:hypothetical protein
LVITLNKDEVRVCREASENWWAAKEKGGNYGKGIIGKGRNPWEPCFIGLLGEAGVGQAFGLDADTQYHKGGAKSDFTLNGLTIDVKTSLLKGKHRKWCIYYKNEWQKVIPLCCDLYVFTHLREYSQDYAVVDLYGFLPQAKVAKAPVLQGNGKHYNYEIYPTTLMPMSGFVDYTVLNAR